MSVLRPLVALGAAALLLPGASPVREISRGRPHHDEGHITVAVKR